MVPNGRWLLTGNTEMIRKMRRLLRSRRGDIAIEAIASIGMQIFLLFVVFAAMVYMLQFYKAGYTCRRVVREIETSGEYNESNVRALTARLAGGGLENLVITVNADYLTGTQHIQLRDDFTVSLTAEYPVTLAVLGGDPVRLRMPIGISMAGMSEVYWK